jgi:hypothetical protein
MRWERYPRLRRPLFWVVRLYNSEKFDVLEAHIASIFKVEKKSKTKKPAHSGGELKLKPSTCFCSSLTSLTFRPWNWKRYVFFRNVGLSPKYVAFNPKGRTLQNSSWASYLCNRVIWYVGTKVPRNLLPSPYPEDGSNIFFRNVGIHLPHYTESQPRRSWG